MGLSVSLRFNGGYVQTAASGILPAGQRFGDTNLPANTFSLSDGTSDNQANQLYYTTFSLATTTGLSVDLKGGNGEKDITNTLLAMVEVRWIYVYISTTPTSAISLRVGPQNQTNAWQGPWAGVGASDYLTIRRRLDIDAPGDGSWTTVDSTHKIFRLYNPSGSTVAGSLIIAGTLS